MKKSSKIGLGILGAAAAGAVIVMILAPKKGKKFRKNVKGSAEELAQILNDLLSRGTGKYQRIKSLVKKKRRELTGDGRELAIERSEASNGFPTEQVKP